jgi:hypothetical protein
MWPPLIFEANINLGMSIYESVRVAVSSGTLTADSVSTSLNRADAGASAVVGAIAAVLAFGGIIFTAREGVRHAEASELRRRLTTFDGPLSQYLALSKKLHEALRAGDVGRQSGQFRTLIALLDGVRFSPNDWALIDALVTITTRARKLVLSGKGVVESRELLDLLADAAAHWEILSLAAHGEIVGDSQRFARWVFPRNLDDAIDQTIASLEAEIKRKSAFFPGPQQQFNHSQQSVLRTARYSTELRSGADSAATNQSLASTTGSPNQGLSAAERREASRKSRKRMDES